MCSNSTPSLVYVYGVKISNKPGHSCDYSYGIYGSVTWYMHSEVVLSAISISITPTLATPL